MEEVARGEIWWLDLPEAKGSSPSGPRPVLIIQANAFNRSAIQTVIAAAITSNERLADAPGNVPLLPRESGLRRTSVINISQIITIDKASLRDRVGGVTKETMSAVDHGLRRVLQL